MNHLPTQIRAHIEECPLCLNFKECSTGALLFAEAEFEARRRFLLWLDGVETLFIPTAPQCWHVRFAFNVGPERERWLTQHYTGIPPGSIRTFEQATCYARAMILPASEDLCDYLRGIRPAPAMATRSRKDESKGETTL